jgi:hypothetical protein
MHARVASGALRYGSHGPLILTLFGSMSMFWILVQKLNFRFDVDIFSMWIICVGTILFGFAWIFMVVCMPFRICSLCSPRLCILVVVDDTCSCRWMLMHRYLCWPLRSGGCLG